MCLILSASVPSAAKNSSKIKSSFNLTARNKLLTCSTYTALTTSLRMEADAVQSVETPLRLEKEQYYENSLNS